MGSVFWANQSVIPHSASVYLGLSGTLRGSHSMSQSFEEHTQQIQNVLLIIVYCSNFWNTCTFTFDLADLQMTNTTSD